MVSPFLIFTQCKITENTAGQCSSYHLSVLAQVLGLQLGFKYQGGLSLKEVIHQLIPTFPDEGYCISFVCLTQVLGL